MEPHREEQAEELLLVEGEVERGTGKAESNPLSGRPGDQGKDGKLSRTPSVTDFK